MIPKYDSKYSQKYNTLHPFTEEFLQKYGFSSRLFIGRKDLSGNKRNFSAITEETKDENEIDLEL